jgi:hypothetical protein
MRIVGTPQDGRGGDGGRLVPLPPPPSVNGRAPGESPAGVPSAQVAAVSGSPGGGGGESRPVPADRELLAKRDRLIERFAAMQLDLGGVYYEMAIRDHVKEDVLIRKSAEMQRVDAELRQVEGVLEGGAAGAGRCPSCDAAYAPSAAFCSQCGSPLAAASPGTRP